MNVIKQVETFRELEERSKKGSRAGERGGKLAYQ